VSGYLQTAVFTRLRRRRANNVLPLTSLDGDYNAGVVWVGGPCKLTMRSPVTTRR